MRSSADMHIHDFWTDAFDTAHQTRECFRILALPCLLLLVLCLSLALSAGPTLSLCKTMAQLFFSALHQFYFSRPRNKDCPSKRLGAFPQLELGQLCQPRRFGLARCYVQGRLRPSRWGRCRRLGVHQAWNCGSIFARK